MAPDLHVLSRSFPCCSQIIDIGEDDDEDALLSADEVSALVEDFAARHLAGFQRLEELVLDFIEPLSVAAVAAVAAACPGLQRLQLTFSDAEDVEGAEFGTITAR